MNLTNAANFSDAEPARTHAARAAGSTEQVALIGHTAAESVFAYRRGVAITAAGFIDDVLALADRLPEAQWVINLAADRYLFAVGLGAALLRRQVTLLPASHVSATIFELIHNYSGVYALTDGLRPHPNLRYVEAERSFGSPLRGSFAVPTVAHDTIALVLFTSGSTGSPVPTEKRWGPFWESIASESEGLALGKSRGLSVLGTVPAQHSYGLESTVLLPMLTGQIIDAGRPFYPADVCSALASLPRPRMLVTTPVHLRALMRSRLLCPPVDLLLSATAPLPIELAREAEERFRAPLMEIYGCSEAGQLATRRPTETPAWKLMRGVAMRQEGDTTWVHGGHVPGEVRLADIIERTEVQHFLLHGRDADLVNIAGKRTSIAFLNHQLIAIDGVEDAVFLMPNEHDDQVTRLTAFVVAPELDEQDILRALRERIDAVFLPRPLWRVPRLPRNEAGKLPRDVLLDLARRLQTQRPRG